MDKENVKFQILGKTFDKIFDRSKIKLGKIFFIREIDGGKNIEISEKEFAESKRFAVSWIATSDWIISLIDIYNLEHSQVQLTQKLLEGYMSKEDVLDCLSYKASELRLEHLYKTSEYDKSSLRIIFAVTERLNFIDSLKSKEVSQQLFHNWEPVIIYHLLTCFDLLGQPAEWMTFDSWISSKDHQEEREKIIKEIQTQYSNVEFSKFLFLGYQKIYGVRNSFLRFIREILPSENRSELFNSIRIHTNTMPPNIATVSEDAPEVEKEKFLYDLRNNYTHKAKVVHGINSDSIFGVPKEFPAAFSLKFQEFKENKWISYFTLNWPKALEYFVKIGLAEHLKTRKANDIKEYTKYSFQYKYYRAFRPDNSEKSGANRILFDLKGEEITREYVPEGFPKEFEWATIEEIDKHNIMYPNIPREALIGNK